MGIYKGKRKRGLTLTVRKKTTYSKCRSRPCYSNSASPFPKRCKTSPTVRTSTPYKKVSPSKDRKLRKQLFDTSYNIDDIQSLTQEFSVLESDDIDDIHNLTDVFSVLDISSNADNNEFNTCISTDTFPTSENQSRGQLSSLSDEIIKLIPSVLNELAKVGKENVLQKFFSQVSCSRFPLNNIAFQLWCDVVDWFDNSDTRQMRYAPETMQFYWVGIKLFGGRFIRFMSSMKNETQQLTGS